MFLAGCGGDANIPPASVLLSGRVRLSWDEVPGAASYNVYMATSPGVTALNSFKIPDVSNPITITDLEPGTTYYFIVTVENDSGASRQSKEVSYTVSNTEGLIEFGSILTQSKPQEKSIAADEVPAASISGAKTTTKPGSAESTDVTLSWDNVPNADSYNIYWRDKPGVTRQNGIKITNAPNPCTMKGFIKGKRYYVVVTAVNASGESRESEEFSFIPGE